MKVLKINEELKSYKGCGRAMAAIENNEIIKLDYLEEDEDGQTAEALLRYDYPNAQIIEGIASCFEFCYDF